MTLYTQILTHSIPQRISAQLCRQNGVAPQYVSVSASRYEVCNSTDASTAKITTVCLTIQNCALIVQRRICSNYLISTSHSPPPSLLHLPPPSFTHSFTHPTRPNPTPNPPPATTSINILWPNQIEKIRYNRYISHPF